MKLSALKNSRPEAKPGKPGLQVIQTTYNGIRYRSRNEARFSALLQEIFGDSIVYEPEGFVVPSGAYLPDFALVDSVGQPQIFFEIKGYDLPLEDAQTKLQELSEITGKPCILFVGFPLNHSMTIYWLGKEVAVRAKPSPVSKSAANLRFEKWDEKNQKSNATSKLFPPDYKPNLTEQIGSRAANTKRYKRRVTK